MFDQTRKNLRGQLLAAQTLDWDGDLYVVIPATEAKDLLLNLERQDAGATLVVFSSALDTATPESGVHLSRLGMSD